MSELELEQSAKDSAAQEVPKRRKPKHTPQDEVSDPASAAPKEPRAARVRKPKMVQATNEDGSLVFEEDGTTPVMVEAPKTTRTPAVSRKAGVYTTPEGAEVNPIGNDALDITIQVVKLAVKPGSKREERYKAFGEGDITVDAFLKAGGAVRDLHRLARGGHITLHKDGEQLNVA